LNRFFVDFIRNDLYPSNMKRSLQVKRRPLFQEILEQEILENEDSNRPFDYSHRQCGSRKK